VARIVRLTRAGDPSFSVRPFEGESEAWDEFVVESDNGTLFHQLRFLEYHPHDRFDFHHIQVWSEGRVVAAVPGGPDAQGLFRSPLGASVGGPVVRTGLSALEVDQVVRALQDYSRSQGWRGLEFTLPPPVIHEIPNQAVEFALWQRGFALAERWMPLMIPLEPPTDSGSVAEKLFSKGHRAAARAARRHGEISVSEGGVELLPSFSPLFEATYSRLRAHPTHTLTEVELLLNRLPDDVRLWVAARGDEPLAAILLFVLNPRVCTTFYICSSDATPELHGSSLLLAELIDSLGAGGYRYLDLGPSAGAGRFNRGVVSFKEHLGGHSFCRDQYRWVGQG
jgi:hypothetical protein